MDLEFTHHDRDDDRRGIEGHGKSRFFPVAPDGHDPVDVFPVRSDAAVEVRRLARAPQERFVSSNRSSVKAYFLAPERAEGVSPSQDDRFSIVVGPVPLGGAGKGRFPGALPANFLPDEDSGDRQDRGGRGDQPEASAPTAGRRRRGRPPKFTEHPGGHAKLRETQLTRVAAPHVRLLEMLALDFLQQFRIAQAAHGSLRRKVSSKDRSPSWRRDLTVPRGRPSLEAISLRLRS